MSRLLIYTVHINPSLPHPYEAAEFVQEGFNWKAFFFTALWALYHRLWWYALGILAFSAALLYFVHVHMFSFTGYFILHFGLHLVVGFYGTDWLRAQLRHKGYLTADITTGDSLLRAEQRYFDRYFATHSAPSIV